MKKILFILFVFPFVVCAGKIGDNFDYSGYVKTEVWLETKTDSSSQYLSSFKNTFDIGLEYEFSDNLAFFFHPRYFYDAAYDIRNNPAFDRNQHRILLMYVSVSNRWCGGRWTYLFSIKLCPGI